MVWFTPDRKNGGSQSKAKACANFLLYNNNRALENWSQKHRLPIKVEHKVVGSNPSRGDFAFVFNFAIMMLFMCLLCAGLVLAC